MLKIPGATGENEIKFQKSSAKNNDCRTFKARTELKINEGII